jgi:hypothetical protein
MTWTSAFPSEQCHTKTPGHSQHMPGPHHPRRRGQWGNTLACGLATRSLGPIGRHAKGFLARRLSFSESGGGADCFPSGTHVKGTKCGGEEVLTGYGRRPLIPFIVSASMSGDGDRP